MYFIFRSKYDYLFSLNFSCPFPYFSRALCHLKSCPSNWFSFVLSWGYNFSWGVGGRGHLRVANKVFKPEPGKRKSFYFAIQFKSIFLRLQIRVKKKKDARTSRHRPCTANFITFPRFLAQKNDLILRPNGKTLSLVGDLWDPYEPYHGLERGLLLFDLLIERFLVALSSVLLKELSHADKKILSNQSSIIEI